MLLHYLALAVLDSGPLQPHKAAQVRSLTYFGWPSIDNPSVVENLYDTETGGLYRRDGDLLQVRTWGATIPPRLNAAIQAGR
jgi:hypothetical protein